MTARHDFPPFKQGETFSRVLTYRDSAGALVNLTGYTAAMPVCRTQVQAGAAAPQPTLLLSGALGTIRFTLAAAETRAMPAGQYEYDLFLTGPSGEARCLLSGRIEVERAVVATP